MANEPKMKIGIGADTGDFDKGAKQVKSALKELGIDANSTAGKLVSSFGKAAVAFAGVVSAIKVVGKALNELKNESQVLSDTWGRACEGMTGAFDAFKSAVVSLDFTNLISNMSEAARLAQDMYDAADAMGEITTAYNIGLAQQLKTIDELRLKMKDTSLSEEERVKAGQELLKIYSQLEKNPTRGLNRVSESTIDYYMQQMGINLDGRTDAQLEQMRKKYIDFFKWLGTKQGESILSQVETIAKSGGLDGYWGKTAIANAQKAGIEENLRLAYAYSTKMGDDDREKLEQAVVAALQQEYKYSQETFKIRKDIQTIQNEATAAAAKAAEEAAKVAAFEKERAGKVVGAIGSATMTGLVQAPVQFIADQRSVNNIKELAAFEFGGMKFTIDFEMDAEKWQQIAERVGNGIKGAVSSATVAMGQAVGQLIGDLATGQDAWGNFANSAISAFGDMAISLGKIAIEAGAEVIALNAALSSMSVPAAYMAIAAGTALVILGAAVKSGMSNIASGNYSAGAGAVSSGSSYSSSLGSFEQRDVYVNVTGTLRADGNQLVAVLNNTNKKNNVTT